MADEVLVNGNTAASGDVEMNDASMIETPLDSVQATITQDPTDPQPPPQDTTPAADSAAVTANVPPTATIPTSSAAAPVARPGSMPPQPSARPEKPVAHGGPTRQYLNANLTPHLLEGMKYLAAYEPEKPLLWLADFLRERSKEVEGS